MRSKLKIRLSFAFMQVKQERTCEILSKGSVGGRADVKKRQLCRRKRGGEEFVARCWAT